MSVFPVITQTTFFHHNSCCVMCCRLLLLLLYCLATTFSSLLTRRLYNVCCAACGVCLYVCACTHTHTHMGVFIVIIQIAPSVNVTINEGLEWENCSIQTHRDVLKNYLTLLGIYPVQSCLFEQVKEKRGDTIKPPSTFSLIHCERQLW